MRSKIRIGKDIGKVAVEHLKASGFDGVMWGDVGILDDIAGKYRNDLFELHPMTRHSRMLTAMERSGLFDVFIVTLPGFRGNNRVRSLKIKKDS